jgi:uncharacterized protein YbaR (Trm112 family)
MKPAHLDVLVCPSCKGALRFDTEQSELICEQDRLAYPIEDGIPMMLVSLARHLDDQSEELA